LLVCLVLFIVAVSATSEVDRSLIPRDQSLKNYELVENWYFSTSEKIVSFTALKRNWRFNLLPSNVTGSGGSLSYWTGYLVGSETLASFNIGPNEISSLIVEHGSFYYIGMAGRVPLLIAHSLNPEQLVIYSSADVNSGSLAGHCGHKQVPEHSRLNVPQNHKRDTGIKNLALYVDGTWFSNQGPDPVALLNDVNVVYQGSGVSTFTINYLGDIGFNAGGDMNTGLNQVKQYVQAREQSFKIYDNIFLLSGNPYGWWRYDGPVGLAWTGTSCWPRDYQPYFKTGIGALMPHYNPNYNWVQFNYPNMIQLVAHELGHNRTPGNPAHDMEAGCYVMSTPLCDTVGGVRFRPSWVPRMC